MTECWKPVGRIVPDQLEIFTWSDGKVTGHWLPGELLPRGDEQEDRLRIERDKYLCLPVGKGGIRDSDGHSWGCHMLVSCSLISPRRFVLRNGRELLAGRTDCEILADVLRGTMQTMMDKWLMGQGTNEVERYFNELQEIIEKAFTKTAVDNGWIIEEIRKGKPVKGA